MKQYNLLLVEDEENQLLAMKTALENEDYKVAESCNANDAINIVKS